MNENVGKVFRIVVYYLKHLFIVTPYRITRDAILWVFEFIWILVSKILGFVVPCFIIMAIVKLATIFGAKLF